MLDLPWPGLTPLVNADTVILLDASLGVDCGAPVPGRNRAPARGFFFLLVRMLSPNEHVDNGQHLGSELRVAIVCSGLGRVARGFERFFHELALVLQDCVEARVFAGKLPSGLRGFSIPCVPRTALARVGFAPERAYYWEQLTFGAGLLPFLVAFRPHVVHVSDPALTNLLLRLRRLVPGCPPLLFCNGGALSPVHYRRYDHVQMVAPWQLDQALAAGIDPSRVTFVPHGIDASRFRGMPAPDVARSRLGLPSGLLAISVAALEASVKRLDYLIQELARDGARDWKLLCLGQPTSETASLQRLAAEIAPGRVLFRTAPAQEVPLYLAAADLFVLASASEGFGLAAAEAMASGLPVVLRDIPSLRYLVNDDAQLDPLVDGGALLKHFADATSTALRRERGERNRARAVSMFDWRSVLPAYLALYEAVARIRP